MVVSDDTEKRLLEAAGQVFAEKSFKEATIREICQQAGANIAAVNYYFRDKERLYRAALHNAFQCKMDQMAMPAWPPGTPATHKLRDFVHTVLMRMLEKHKVPWQMQLLMRELCQPSAVGEELVREFIRPMYEMLWVILRELLPVEVTEARLHLIAVSIIGQCFYMRVGREVIALVVGAEEYRGHTTDALAEHITQLTLAALGYGPPLAKPGAAV
jgi:AcrR family transcriptional regulator